MKLWQKMFLTLTAAALLISPEVGRAHTSDFQPFDEVQKKEDFDWLTGQINEYYGMMDYKQEKWKFDWKKVQDDYWTQAADPKIGRDEFMGLMMKMVAGLKDAHTALYN